MQVLETSFAKRTTMLLRRWLRNKFSFEAVMPILPQMIEHLLKIINVPGFGKPVCVNSFEENPLCAWPDGWDVLPPSHPSRRQKRHYRFHHEKDR
jgi:hypothetical protein